LFNAAYFSKPVLLCAKRLHQLKLPDQCCPFPGLISGMMDKRWHEVDPAPKKVGSLSKRTPEKLQPSFYQLLVKNNASLIW